MLTDARTILSGTQRRCDLAILGAGPAGLTLARALRSSGLDVVVLEAGGLEAHHPPETGPQPAPTGSYDLGVARARGFGGTANTFLPGGWRARPMDPGDFAAWPLRHDDLLPYYRRAQEACGLGAFEYDGAPWMAREGEPSLVVDDEEIATSVFQLGPPGHFRAMADAVRGWQAVEVILGAVVTELVPSPNGEHIEALRVRAVGGGAFELRPRAVVLACGGVDNARVLLASGDGGIGNRHDLVGRFFMEHIHADTGVFWPASPALLARMQFYLPHGTPGDGGFQGALSFRDAVREREGLRNCIFWLYPVPRAWATDGGRSARVLRDALAGRRLPEASGGHLWQCLRHAPALAAIAGRKLLRRPGAPVAARFAVEAEQEPHRDSRVTLTGARDAWGVPVPRLDWRITDADRASIRRTQERLDALLRRRGLGRIEQLLGDEHPRAHLGGGHHHMGTTRMHTDPAQGVVDADCRVHGVDNLFVAGSSVFPTSGAANPTLTIVALALRLADTLRRELVLGARTVSR